MRIGRRIPWAAVIVGSLACGDGAGDSTTAGDDTGTSGASTSTDASTSAVTSATEDATTNATGSADTTVDSTDDTADGTDDSGTEETGEPTIDCAAMVCHYVLSSATGAGDGSSWTDAFVSLPADLERGATYLVGGGAYPAYTFDDPPDGAVVTIVKATVGDHGTDDGWEDAFGEQQATFDSTLVIEQGDLVFDGAVRNDADWFDGEAYGFRIAAAGQDQNIVISNYGVSIDNVAIRNVFVDAIVGDLPTTTIRRYAIDTDGFDGGSTATNLVFSRMFVRGSNNVWFLRTTEGAIVEYCASDEVASNSDNHGEIVNLYYSGNNAIVRFNQWRNAFLVGGGGTALVAITQADGLQFYGNVLRDFAVGDGAVGFDGFSSSHNRIYNNTFVGNHGLNAGTAFDSGTDNLVFNNVWVDAGTVNIAGTHDFNAFGDDNPRSEANAQINVGAAFFVDLDGGDVHLSMNTDPGMDLGVPFDVDADGAPRETWSRGAYEY